MLIRVKTLTGKEIELDIEKNEKIEAIKQKLEEKEGIVHEPESDFAFLIRFASNPSSAATSYLWWQANVRLRKHVVVAH
jgi:hypothetical protein